MFLTDVIEHAEFCVITLLANKHKGSNNLLSKSSYQGFVVGVMDSVGSDCLLLLFTPNFLTLLIFSPLNQSLILITHTDVSVKNNILRLLIDCIQKYSPSGRMIQYEQHSEY